MGRHIGAKRSEKLDAIRENPDLPLTLACNAGDGMFSLAHLAFYRMLERGVPVAAAIVLLAGILTSLTPCVWPVIPLVLLYLAAGKYLVRGLTAGALKG